MKISRPSLRLLAFTLLLLSRGELSAAQTAWTNGSVGDWFISTNWNNGVGKLTLFLFSAVLFLTGGASVVRAQSALDGFDPNANGTVRVVVVQPDGKILLGGDFTALSPNGGAAVTRNRIARLNPDGTLDTAFNPNASGAVHAIAVQADGRILVGGQFTNVGGQARNRIARLDATTGLADSFNPNASGTVLAIAVQANGRILAGGSFFGANSIGGATRNFIARLDAASGLADSFNPNANDFVRAITVQGDGQILVGGDFRALVGNSIGGAVRNRIARLDPVAGLADSFDPNANNQVLSIAVQADGNILAGGFFTSIGGQTRNRIARLDAISGATDSFDPNANSQVNTIAVQADGKILAGGAFNGANSIGGATRNRIARLDPATGLADSFNANASNPVLTIAQQADGKILAAGTFNGANSVGGQTRNYIARLETDGRLDRTLDLGVLGESSVYATAVQPDGKILIGGGFTNVLGVTRNNIARLNTDGTLDMAFIPNADNDVYSIVVQGDGKILAGGLFNSIGGQARNRIARLDPTTGLADSFNPNADDIISTMVVQADGKVLVGGFFNSIGGAMRNFIARLDPTTGLADSFDPNANGAVFSIAVQADGKILAGGQFLGIGGQARNRIARLDATAGLADSFNPNANGEIDAIAVQPDGLILVAGFFTTIGGETRKYISRLHPATGLADSFDPNANAGAFSIAVQADGKILVSGHFMTIGGVTRQHFARLDATTGSADSFDPSANQQAFAIALQADGKILAGGVFNFIGGQTRNGFARLSNDTAALQSLMVTRSTITWTRGGSSPELTRVTFEYSTDNLNFTSLGNGTAVGSNWTLAGLSLPTGQNLYVRARGYYCNSGFSESITESVRNAFLARPAVPLLSGGSRKTHGSAGSFEIDVVSENLGVECRSGGAGNNHTIVFRYGTPLVSVGAVNFFGAGSISSSGIGSDPAEYIVELAGVTNAQTVTVYLSDIQDAVGNYSRGNSIAMGVLLGDTTGNGTVNASDIGQTKAQSGQTTTAGNFRTDVNVNGSINASDIGQVKSTSGTALP